MTTQANNVAIESSQINSSGILQPAGGGTGLSAPGTAGNVLTSDGTNWTSAAAGGGSAMTLISTQNAAGLSVLSFTGLSGYDNYLLIVENVSRNAAGGSLIYMRFGYGGTPTYVTSGYYFQGNGILLATGGGLTPQGTNLSYGLLWYSTTSAADLPVSPISGYCYFTGFLAGDNISTNGMYGGVDKNTSNFATMNISNAMVGGSGPITAIQITMNSGTMGSGKFSLYGISA